VATAELEALDAAIALRALGFWTVAIYACGEVIATRHGLRTSAGKNPIGFGWGNRRWDEAQLRRELAGDPGRGELVAAALTILRSFVAAGRPDPRPRPMDYPAWCGLIRNAVHWATGLDPGESRSA
jgi:hypothetical protein